MIALIIRRLLQLPAILFVVFLLTFTLAWLVPGNPLENPEGRRPPPEVEEAMKRQYRLDDPVAFFVDYLGKASGIAWLMGAHPRPFDLGPSLRHPDWSVNEILAAGLPVSITLGLSAIALACAIGITAGIVGGLSPGSFADFSTLLIALAGISLPPFVVGAALLIVFAVWLGVAPLGGWGDLAHLALPAITLSLPFAAYIARLTRFGMIEQMSSDHVRTARAKGLSERRAALRHALRNALLPVLSFLGPATAAAMTGSFVVEKVFAVPGIGRHFVDGVLGKDLTLVMGVVLVYATLLVLFNLAVDVAYRWVDPRIESS
ncbi:MAG TPA: ABC transporter permease [Phycisphaerales bacterium]|nr:ABC transporter permease [Phycisphaerales bacterium]HMP36105.1 ABC transporter permease [Phycisphaerales bacterium]